MGEVIEITSGFLPRERALVEKSRVSISRKTLMCPGRDTSLTLPIRGPRTLGIPSLVKETPSTLLLGYSPDRKSKSEVRTFLIYSIAKVEPLVFSIFTIESDR